MILLPERLRLNHEIGRDDDAQMLFLEQVELKNSSGLAETILATEITIMPSSHKSLYWRTVCLLFGIELTDTIKQFVEYVQDKDSAPKNQKPDEEGWFTLEITGAQYEHIKQMVAIELGPPPLI